MEALRAHELGPRPGRQTKCAPHSAIHGAHSGSRAERQPEALASQQARTGLAAGSALDPFPPPCVQVAATGRHAPIRLAVARHKRRA